MIIRTTEIILIPQIIALFENKYFIMILVGRVFKHFETSNESQNYYTINTQQPTYFLLTLLLK